MNIYKALFMSAILCIGGLYIWNNNLLETSDKETADEKSLMTTLSKESLHSISFTREGSIFSLKKTATDDTSSGEERSIWVLDAPQGARVQESSLTDFLSALNALAPENTLSEKETGGDLSPFGLFPPAVKISLKGAGFEQFILLGSEHPITHRYYTQISGDSSVYLIPDHNFQALNKQANDFRIKKPLQAFALGAKEIHFQPSSKETFTLKTNPEEISSWKLTIDDLSLTPDESEVTKLRNELAELTVKDYIDTPSSYLLAAFTKPLSRIRFIDTQGTTHDVTLVRVQDERHNPSQNADTIVKPVLYFFRIEGEPWVYQAERFLSSSVIKDPYLLISKTPFESIAGNISRITTDTFSLLKNDQAWRIEGEQSNINEEKVSPFLESLKNLESLSYAKEFSNDYAAQIELFNSEGTSLGAIKVGKAITHSSGTESEGAPLHARIRFPDGNELEAVLSSETVKRLLVTKESLTTH